MSAINLQGQSRLGGFVKSALGARTILGTKCILKSDGAATGLLTPTVVRAATTITVPSNVTDRKIFIRVDHPYNTKTSPVQDTYITATGSSDAPQYIGKHITGRGTNGKFGTQRQRLLMSFSLPNLTGATSAKLHIEFNGYDNVFESVQPAVYVATYDGTNWNPTTFVSTGIYGISGDQNMQVSLATLNPYSLGTVYFLIGTLLELNSTGNGFENSSLGDPNEAIFRWTTTNFQAYMEINY